MTTTRTTYTLDVPGRLSTVNATRRRHWSVESAVTKLFRQDVYFVAKAAKIPRDVVLSLTMAAPERADARNEGMRITIEPLEVRDA